MTHSKLTDDLRDLAAAFALGDTSLPGIEAFGIHLPTCLACSAEVQAVKTTLEGLAQFAPAGRAPATLRARVLKGLRDAGASSTVQTWKGWQGDLAEGMTLVRGADSAWEPTAIPGIEARRLFVDPVADRVTMVVRMAPGTAYPAHLHGGAEECYVLAGSLRVGDELVLAAGDYQRVPGGSRHPVQATDEGCVLLLVSSLHDEIQEPG